jgi:hypothetical protein
MVGPMAVTPLRVIEDSRCPVDVDCVWPGRVVLAIRLEQGGSMREEAVETPLGLEFDGAVLTLAEVQPVRTVSNRTQALDYRFGFSLVEPPLPQH